METPLGYKDTPLGYVAEEFGGDESDVLVCSIYVASYCYICALVLLYIQLTHTHIHTHTHTHTHTHSGMLYICVLILHVRGMQARSFAGATPNLTLCMQLS